MCMHACCTGDLSSWLFSSLLHFLLGLLCPAPISTTLKIIDANGVDDDDGGDEEQLDKGGSGGHHNHKVNIKLTNNTIGSDRSTYTC